MFNSQLKDYVKIYQGFYEPDFCKQVVAEISHINWQMHQFYQAGTGNHVSYDHELSVSHEVVQSKLELDKKIWDVLARYIGQDMAYMKDWFSSWSGYSLSRFNRYDPTTQMKLHCDHIQTLFDGERKGIPVLTILGSLNNDYEGGELILCGEKIDLREGDVIVFPSNFLYPHEVKPVKSGVRYSFVSWAW
jgi:predicted 2-oxoglutarate/Fe(II)-dependent dioxygenase YbiX